MNKNIELNDVKSAELGDSVGSPPKPVGSVPSTVGGLGIESNPVGGLGMESNPVGALGEVGVG